WTGADEGLFEDIASATTDFTMPAGDTTLTATYKTAPTYIVIEDLGTTEGDEDKTAVIDAPSDEFVRVTLEGDTIDPDNYIVSEGALRVDSTEITFKQSYIDTLENGTYVYKVEFADGYAYITLVVDRSANNEQTNVPEEEGTKRTASGGTKTPRTGDSQGLLGIYLIANIIIIGILCIQIWKRITRRWHESQSA
ncbi:MAG: hypothetical protein FWH40_07890, partial [Coriobacteriia bacterium]|nr:hypothetical protein [Coriobacteriia bacterium]